VLAAAGFTDVRTISDSTQALTAIRNARPDLLLLDLHMPQPDGFAILDTLESEGVDRELLSVLILRGDHSLDVKKRATSDSPGTSSPSRSTRGKWCCASTT
jgi:putative two-component system response regulator